ncbi:phosphatidylserine decarboxylase [Pigmentiphaga sp. NML080357]|uniref:archaetidylserine decarboxylase n=1 Tax=Pigmentiphaga sp. NML080357 TaxID=2008675 RepID=UPI000B42003D|nr:archaetidylserine decarboxylase [Pigmentiphaga sp. NML080357]OVZ59954.1 phosphatidylserine decarboxylase [Pigmentiphaga sp. NML080357]
MSIKDQLFIYSQYLAPQALISSAFGRLAQCRTAPLKNRAIARFIRQYGVDMSEALEPDPTAYEHFNAFFTRALKPGARPLDASPGAILCPADGAISQLGAIREGRIFQAKGHDFSAAELLGGDDLRAQPFLDGAFATIYLSPRDYHRVHMPVAGTLRETVYVPGRLFSVNPLTARSVPRLFARNERLACLFDTEHGPMAVVLVGAMIVGAMETVWAGQVAPHGSRIVTTRYEEGAVRLEKGAEMGRFKLGSTVVLLLAPGRLAWSEALGPLSGVRMGEALGRAVL